MAFFGAPPQPSLARVERKLDAIIKHLGIEVPSGMSSRVEDALRAGRKIEAIKIYREETGVGLKEAKEAVEAME